MVKDFRVDLPGLLKESMPSGRFRYRVRVEGKKWIRIALSVGPDHREFLDHYRAAHAGVQLGKDATPATAAVPKTVDWPSHAFEAAMGARVAAGLMHKGILHQRAQFYVRLRAEYGAKDMNMPRHIVMRIRDSMTATPGAADNMIKAIRALYAWGIDQAHVSDNPASGISTINRGTGATPWSVSDMKQFRSTHPIGTVPHLALTLFMFTACRIDDVVKLGRGNETLRDGIASLSWMPGKRGSAPVTVPIMPPLERALAARKIVGSTYLLSMLGRPYASGAAFGNKFRRWVAEAGLTDRSPHGIRKAAAELMALEGASQYHIMAVHGHTQAATSEIYTKGVNRTKLAAEAMSMMTGMDW